MSLIDVARECGQPTDTLPNRNPHLFICTPCHQSSVDLQYHLSILHAAGHMMSHGINFTTDYILGMTVDGARSMMATTFLRQHPECTHLMFIDSDMAFAPDLPYRLVRENVDIVAVPYRRKQSRVLYNVRHGVECETIAGRPYMVSMDNMATGMMLIRRNVFETLAKTVPEFRRNDKGETDLLFFRHDLVDDEPIGGIAYMGEDYHFCKIAKEAGFKVWAYVDEDIAHIGAYAYRGNYREFAEQELPDGKKGNFSNPEKATHGKLRMIIL